MPTHVNSLRHSTSRLILGLTVSLVAIQYSVAQPITDGDVPALMDAGGTEVNPARYIIGENGRYDRDFGNELLAVGDTSSWNSLSIRNGSVVTLASGIGVGNQQGSNYNDVSVDAASLSVSYLDVGSDGNHNRFRVINGGSVHSAHDVYVGYFGGYFDSGADNGGNGNELIVSGVNSLLTMGTSLNVGFYGSGNKLAVENGGTVRVGTVLTLSASWSAGANTALVTGSGSLLQVGNSSSTDAELNVGLAGSDNVLRVADGGTVNVHGDIYIGRQGSADGELFVSGTGSSVQAESIYIGIVPDPGFPGGGTQGNGNTLRVEDGGKVTLSESLLIGSPNGQDNAIVVSGQDSVLYVENEIAFGSGLSGNNIDGINTLTVTDGGLVNIGFLFVDPSANEGENIIRLNGGFIAWHGDHLDGLAELLNDGLIQIWNPETGQWESALGSEYFSYGYFDSDEAALAFSGYEGLGGTTIFTGMIPEPATYAAIVGAVAIGLISVRRRRMIQVK